jgi:hypothetical protein
MRTHDMRQSLSLVLLATVLVAGMTWSACIEQTPLNLPTQDVCGVPDPGDGVSGETTDDGIPADTVEDTAADTTADTTADTPADTAADTAADTPADVPADTPPDTCQPDCANQGCGADDGCGGFCPGTCDPGWECVPALGDCMPEGCSDDDGGFVAAFPDPFLLAKVTDALGEAVADAGLTWDQAASIQELYAGSDGTDGLITELSGIQCLRNLEVLELTGHGLPAASLDGIMTLEKLRHLDLGENAIADFAPFAGARFADTLIYLKLYSNPTGDLVHLGKLGALEYLSLDDTAVTGVDALADAGFKISLRLLRMNGSGLLALPPVGDFAALRVLELAENDIGDLASFDGAVPLKGSLVILRLGGNTGINDLGPLAGAFEAAAPPIPDSLDGWIQDWRPTLSLYGIDLAGVDLPLAPLKGMEHLLVLDLRAAGLETLDDIIDWDSYQEISDTGIRLQTLDISYNDGMTSLSPIVLQPLQTIWQTLRVLKADGVFNVDTAPSLPPLWLPAGAGNGPVEISLKDNAFTAANLQTFGDTSEGAFALLETLSLANNAIDGGLGPLTGLATGKALNTVDLQMNPGLPCDLPELCDLHTALGSLGPWGPDQMDGTKYLETGLYSECPAGDICP